VELPFRGRRSRFSRPTVFRLAAASICVILTAGVLGHVLRGLPGRLPDRVQQLAAGARDRDERTTSCHTSSPHRVLSGDLCTLGGSKDTVQFLVWGDSHAVALMPAFEMLASRHRVTGRIASYTGCPPLLGIRRADRDLTHECSEFNAAVASYIRTNRIADVVLVARWSAMPSAYLTRLTPPDHR
jgi:hypothetical protein